MYVMQFYSILLIIVSMHRIIKRKGKNGKKKLR